MIKLNVCPSTLQEGFSTYSPTALKQLFDGEPVSHILDFDSPNNESADNEAYVKNVGRISLSGVQPKASLVVNRNHQLVKPTEGKHGTYILKPAPTSYALFERKYCPANEHLTMQLALQDKGLFKEGMQLSDVKNVSRKDFEEFGRRIGLSPRLVHRELDTFAAEFPMVKELIDHSFLSDDLKRSYWLSYKYRRSTLV